MKRFARVLPTMALAALGYFSPAVKAQESPGVSESEILLGQSASFTGSFAGQATAYRDGALLYFDHINSQGGVGRRKIKLLSLDDGYVVDKAVANTTSLIEKEKVFALFNYTWTNTVKATIPMAAAAKVPYFGPYTGFQEMYGTHNPYVFTTRASFKDELAKIVRHLSTTGTTRIALLHNDSASGKELLADTQELLAQTNIKLVGTGVMKANSKDPAAAVAALKDADIQALILGASGSDAIAFIKEFDKQAKYRPPYYARSLINATQLAKELGKQADGISVTQTAPNPFKIHNTAVASEYRKLLAQKSPDAVPDYIALEGFISAKIMVEGLRRAGDKTTREKLIAALEGLRNYDAGGYFVRFDNKNHHGSRYVDLTLIARGGKVFD